MLKYFKFIGVAVGFLWLSGICSADELSYDNGSPAGYKAFAPY